MVYPGLHQVLQRLQAKFSMIKINKKLTALPALSLLNQLLTSAPIKFVKAKIK